MTLLSTLPMKTLWMMIGLTTLSQGLWAQANRTPGSASQSRDEATKALAEATRVLEKARASGQTEMQRRSREQAADTGRMEKLMAAAKATVAPSNQPAEKERVANSDARLSQAISTISPEGKAMLAQNEQVIPTLRVPDPVAPPRAVATKPSVLSADGPGPKPQPLKPTPLTPVAKKAPEQTTITATGPDSASFFDGSQSMGVFTGDVEVTHPQFHLTCDTLEVYMVKEGDKKDVKPGTPAPTAAQLAKEGAAAKTGPVSESTENSNIKQAIAKGRKVVINKLSDTGEMQIGTCRHATFVGSTGDMIMRDYPQVQKGTNLILATDPSTTITILNNGQLKVNGPATTKIIQQEEKKKPAAAAASAVPAPTTNFSKPQGAPQ
jgi:hypothetical protein